MVRRPRTPLIAFISAFPAPFIHDDADTSTGYASYYNVLGALKCSACRVEWKYYTPK